MALERAAIIVTEDERTGPEGIKAVTEAAIATNTTRRSLRQKIKGLE